VASDEPAAVDRRQAGAAITRYAAPLIRLTSSAAALAAVFSGLLQLDLPIVHYVRSVTVHLPWDQLTIPWMAFTSNAGDWIGEGSHLVAVSLLLLALGWGFSRVSVKRAGLESLLAHGIAAVVSNGLKHLLGRPRPKFVHSGEWQFTPSWASGLDSFPSGHTTASFAVATVLARRFPWSAPLCFAIAAFVALSRVLRGSHFPTDVFGGAVFGLLSGFVASGPWPQWRASLEEGLRQAAIGMATAFAILWTLAHPADQGVTGTLLKGLGVLAIATGLWLRRDHWSHDAPPVSQGNEKGSRVLMAYGLACITTAPLVLASVGFACVAYWFTDSSDEPHARPSQTRKVLVEGGLLAGMVVAFTILFQGRGVLPFP
jgi:membrane-associated phospholipid phosphatase